MEKIRNPKSEIRNKHEYRNGEKSERTHVVLRFEFCSFWICFELQYSDFEFQSNSTRSMRSRFVIAHQSSLSPSGASSCCAVATASSTCAAISARIFFKASESNNLWSRIIRSARSSGS